MREKHPRTDAELKREVIDELVWVPDIDATNIGVSVSDGAVTLSGEVGTFPERSHAERAALRVRGVTAVADEIMVHNAWSAINDTDIAREAGEALDRAIEVPRGSVKAVVRDHVITLSGVVTWHFQRQAAERAVNTLRGVTDVVDDITIQPPPAAADVREAITSALVRNAQVDSSNVEVSCTSGGVVTLRGKVQSHAERRQAEHAAWATAGVTNVTNLIRIEN